MEVPTIVIERANAEAHKYLFSPICKKAFSPGSGDDEPCRERPVQRRLSFDKYSFDEFEEEYDANWEDENRTDSDGATGGSPKSHLQDSPPYKKVKSLTMAESYSSTPCNGRCTPPIRDTSLLTIHESPSTRRRFSYRISPISHEKTPATLQTDVLRHRLKTNPAINPFTPTGKTRLDESLKSDKMDTSGCADSNGNSSHVVDRAETALYRAKNPLTPSFRELEISRFGAEFKIDSFIAQGSFGMVYECTHYLDGMKYAVKKTAHAVAGTVQESESQKEVFALSALKSHKHVVRYYSSWVEEGHLFLQIEFCNGGSLEKLIEDASHEFTECAITRLTKHVAKGLKFIHSQSMAHMDLKPENIFIHRVERVSSDEDYDEKKDDRDITYKIGDFGLVTYVDNPTNVDEGDCRYMPKELLYDNYKHLQKSDIFSFGMTLYEAAGGGPLPKNGERWQDLRNAKVPHLPKYSSAFNQLIKIMLHPEPEKRPDARQVLNSIRISPADLRQKIISLERDLYLERVHTRHRRRDSPNTTFVLGKESACEKVSA